MHTNIKPPMSFLEFIASHPVFGDVGVNVADPNISEPVELDYSSEPNIDEPKIDEPVFVNPSSELVGFVLHSFAVYMKTRFIHLETSSYGLHKSLEDFYEKIEEHADNIAEALIGVTGQKLSMIQSNGNPGSYKIFDGLAFYPFSVEYTKNCILEYKEKALEVFALIEGRGEFQGISTTISEIFVAIDELLYKLSLVNEENINEEKYIYDIFGLNGSGDNSKRTKVDSLNDDEYNTYMIDNEKSLVKNYAGIEVVRSDGKTVHYDSVGDKLVKHDYLSKRKSKINSNI